MEEAVVSHLHRLHHGGVKGDDLVRQALSDTLKAWMARHLRQIQSFCMVKAGDGANSIISGATRAGSAVDVDAMVKRILRQESQTDPAARAEPIYIDDEDLMRPL